MTMNLVKATPSEITYPYDLWRLSSENPNVSFPINPSAEDLAPFSVFFVEPTRPPEVDLRIERIDETTPVRHENGTWKQSWEVRSATQSEIAEWDANNPPAARWTEFATVLAISPSVNELFSAIPPAVGSALSIGLLQASKGEPELFFGVWRALSQQISPDTRTAIIDAALQHNLPGAFISAL